MTDSNPDATFQLPPDITHLYHSIHQLILSTNTALDTLLTRNQQDFMLAFYQKMKIVHEEYEQLRAKMDEQMLRIKADQKLSLLQEERDYFRAQAIRLDGVRKKQSGELRELQMSKTQILETNTMHQSLLVSLKEQNQLIKGELAKIIQSLKLGFTSPKLLPSIVSDILVKAGQLKKAQKPTYISTGVQTLPQDQKERENMKKDNLLLQYKDRFRQIKGLISEFVAERSELEQLFKECVNVVEEDVRKRGRFGKFFKDDKRRIMDMFLTSKAGGHLLQSVFHSYRQSTCEGQQQTKAKKSRGVEKEFNTRTTNYMSARVKSAQPLKIRECHGAGFRL